MSMSFVGAARLAAAFPGLVEEVRSAAAAPEPLVLTGPPALVGELARGLVRGGDRSLVRELSVAALRDDALGSAAALVYVVRGELAPTDEHALATAGWHRVPVVCVVLGERDAYRAVLPIVPAAAVVHASSIDETAVAAVAERIAVRAAELVWPLAPSLPLLRPHVLRALARRHARHGAVAGLTLQAHALSQVRMVLQMAAVKGLDPGRAVLPAALGAGVAGLGLVLLARSLAGRSFPLSEAAAAYAGTRILGRVADAVLERAGAVGGR